MPAKYFLSFSQMCHLPGLTRIDQPPLHDPIQCCFETSVLCLQCCKLCGSPLHWMVISSTITTSSFFLFFISQCQAKHLLTFTESILTQGKQQLQPAKFLCWTDFQDHSFNSKKLIMFCQSFPFPSLKNWQFSLCDRVQLS